MYILIPLAKKQPKCLSNYKCLGANNFAKKLTTPFKTRETIQDRLISFEGFAYKQTHFVGSGKWGTLNFHTWKMISQFGRVQITQEFAIFFQTLP